MTGAPATYSCTITPIAIAPPRRRAYAAASGVSALVHTARIASHTSRDRHRAARREHAGGRAGRSRPRSSPTSARRRASRARCARSLDLAHRARPGARARRDPLAPPASSTCADLRRCSRDVDRRRRCSRNARSSITNPGGTGSPAASSRASPTRLAAARGVGVARDRAPTCECTGVRSFRAACRRCSSSRSLGAAAARRRQQARARRTSRCRPRRRCAARTSCAAAIRSSTICGGRCGSTGSCSSRTTTIRERRPCPKSGRGSDGRRQHVGRALHAATASSSAACTERFAWALRLEGSGLMADGRVINYTGKCQFGYGTCFEQLDVDEHPFGRGAGVAAAHPVQVGRGRSAARRRSASRSTSPSSTAWCSPTARSTTAACAPTTPAAASRSARWTSSSSPTATSGSCSTSCMNVTWITPHIEAPRCEYMRDQD